LEVVLLSGIDKDKNTQVLVTLPHRLLADIENYWYEKRLKSRSEATRELIVQGLEKARPFK